MDVWAAVRDTVYPNKYAHGFCFAVLCCGYTLTDYPISIRLTSLELCQSNDCPSASKATLMNMDKYFMWIHYERLHNHNKAKHNKTVCIFLGIYCRWFILTSSEGFRKPLKSRSHVNNQLPLSPLQCNFDDVNSSLWWRGGRALSAGPWWWMKIEMLPVNWK